MGETVNGKIEGIAGKVLDRFAADFLDAEFCRHWFLDLHYPGGPTCPDCGAAITSPRSRESFYGLRRFTCPDCGSQPKATKGTILHDSHLDPHELVLLSALINFNVESREISRILNISTETVTAWRAKLAAFAEVEATQVTA